MDERLYSVYMHITPSDKRYIGITSLKVDARWRGGSGYSYNTHFYSAIQKYGWSNIQHIVLAESITKERAIEMEIALILDYDTTNPLFGYNVTIGGNANVPLSGVKNGMYGRTHTPEVKKRLSEKATARFANKENHPMYGKPKSQETREKIRATNTGKCAGEKNYFYGKHFIGEQSPAYGKHLSDETKEKIRAAHIGKNLGSMAYNATSVRNVETGEIFGCAMDIKRKYGFDNSWIGKCCRNRAYTYKGFHWEYV